LPSNAAPKKRRTSSHSRPRFLPLSSLPPHPGLKTRVAPGRAPPLRPGPYRPPEVSTALDAHPATLLCFPAPLPVLSDLKLSMCAVPPSRRTRLTRPSWTAPCACAQSGWPWPRRRRCRRDASPRLLQCNDLPPLGAVQLAPNLQPLYNQYNFY